MNLKGTLPTLILQVLEDGANHGYRIAQLIKQRSRGVLDFKEGTLYPTLHGLEGKGLIEAYTRQESGRRRRYYRLTEHGHSHLARERKSWRELSRAVNLILKKA